MISFYARDAEGAVVPSSDTPMRFPGGEQHIVDEAPEGETPLYAFLTGAGAEDYISAAMWVDLQLQKGFTDVSVMIPYLPGARQDRGQPLGAQVYADLINSINAARVVCFDPHSDFMPSLIKNIVVVDSADLIFRVLNSVKKVPYTGLICPDAGARKRSERVAEQSGLPLFYAEKKRDFKTGKLSGFSCEPLPEDGRYLITDDIGDGCGTFIGLAKELGLPREQLGLWVSHGVFSAPQKGSEALKDTFFAIYTTDSHPGHTNPWVQPHVLPIRQYLERYALS